MPRTSKTGFGQVKIIILCLKSIIYYFYNILPFFCSRHNMAEILLWVVLNTNQSINQIISLFSVFLYLFFFFTFKTELGKKKYQHKKKNILVITYCFKRHNNLLYNISCKFPVFSLVKERVPI